MENYKLEAILSLALGLKIGIEGQIVYYYRISKNPICFKRNYLFSNVTYQQIDNIITFKLHYGGYLVGFTFDLATSRVIWKTGVFLKPRISLANNLAALYTLTKDSYNIRHIPLT